MKLHGFFFLYSWTMGKLHGFFISGGMGGATSLGGKDVEHAFVELYGETDKESSSAVSLGYAPHLGVNWSPIDMWKIRIERGRFQSLIGEKKVYHVTRFDQRMTISQNWDIRLENFSFGFSLCSGLCSLSISSRHIGCKSHSNRDIFPT